VLVPRGAVEVGMLRVRSGVWRGREVPMLTGRTNRDIESA